MRRDGGHRLFENIIELCRAPVPIVLASAVVVGVTFHGVVQVAENHRSALEICTEAGGDWTDAYQNCDMP
jgi:hypothetical protein